MPPRGGRRWNTTTVRHILTNPVYTGQIYAEHIQSSCGAGTPRRTRPREEWIAVAPVPAVVTQERFDRVQDKLAQNQQFARRNNTTHPYLLRALVSCGVCGLSCTGRSLSPGYRYYQCRGKLSALHSHRDTTCPARLIPAAQLDALLWDDLCQMLTHPETIRLALERAHGGHWLPQELQAHRNTLRHGQASLQRQVERLTEAYLAGVMDLAEYQRRRRDLEQRQQALAGQERQLEAQADRQAEITRLGLNVEQFCQRVSQGLEQASWEQKRQLIEWLVARVIVTNGEVEIRYVIPTSPTGETDRFCHLRSDHRILLPPHETDGLEVRPMFHWIARRIEAHVKLCVLALQMQWAAEIRCGLPWARIVHELGALKAVRYKAGGQGIVQRTKIASELADLMKKLGISIPKRLLTVTEAPGPPSRHRHTPKTCTRKALNELTDSGRVSIDRKSRVIAHPQRGTVNLLKIR